MSGPMREMTPDEIVADIEAKKPRKGKVTIYQSTPRMILERERARAARTPVSPEGLDVLILGRAVSLAFDRAAGKIEAGPDEPSSESIATALGEAVIDEYRALAESGGTE